MFSKFCRVNFAIWHFTKILVSIFFGINTAQMNREATEQTIQKLSQHISNHGPVVQNIVSLMSLLRGQLVKFFMTL